MENYLLTVVGPTAIGKTALGIKLANHYNTEIISADSRQFFKEMAIGTAVPTTEELASAKHHFIQNKSIFDNYSVGHFEREGLELITDLFTKFENLIMVGGSGLYVDAIIKGLDYFPDVDPSIRESLNSKLEKEGITSLQEQLKELDPVSYSEIAIDNPHRLIRALEISIGAENPFSYYKNQEKPTRNFTPIKIGLKADREIIYDRINRRVDIMVEEGLIEEARKVYPNKDLNALQTVGYRELFAHFDGDISLEFALEEIKKNTRRFAKRQMTWFRKDENILWFDYQIPFSDIISEIESYKNKIRK
ncbi:tRNA (adenosine(37)-N6)-dimethylallyltransferase MiaA [Aureivirga sp. CE67]|uniref:tRNA (adenosine(37)-N6)-dimethylallyltransferase MiaA n=1 Tax=Aureivirga sp. CE67 TaxID=1788983 RepID=UPI0018CA4364|nr:tRNA (adenosine(37)-N6)-dimethylallyltransferase MiaA [Aureivirga sp. CE67]